MQMRTGLRTPNASGGSVAALSADGTLPGRGYTNEQKKLFHSQLNAITQKEQQKNNVGQHLLYSGQGFATQGGTTSSGAGTRQGGLALSV